MQNIQNPLLYQYQQYQQQNNVPFANNQLLQNNIHIMNNMPQYQQQQQILRQQQLQQQQLQQQLQPQLQPQFQPQLQQQLQPQMQSQQLQSQQLQSQFQPQFQQQMQPQMQPQMQQQQMQPQFHQQIRPQLLQQQIQPQMQPHIQSQFQPQIQPNLLQSQMQPNLSQQQMPLTVLNSTKPTIINKAEEISFSNNTKKTKKGKSIIEELLKPVSVSKKSNPDVPVTYENESTTRKTEKHQITNKPYKTIIKNIAQKEIVNKEDLTVHIVTNKDKIGMDVEYDKFKEKVKEVDVEIKLEYAPDKYDKHKKDFEYKKSYVDRLKMDAPTHEDLKSDQIEFYKHHQKEMETGKEQCDKILYSLIDSGLLKKEEIPENEMLGIDLDQEQDQSASPVETNPVSVPSSNQTNTKNNPVSNSNQINTKNNPVTNSNQINTKNNPVSNSNQTNIKNNPVPKSNQINTKNNPVPNSNQTNTKTRVHPYHNNMLKAQNNKTEQNKQIKRENIIEI